MVAVFDQFHGAIEVLEDPVAKRLVANWADVRGNYVAPTEAPRSALAAGMEQGLRETPMLLGSMRLEARKAANEALGAAIAAHYPEFLVKDAAQLEKIRLRGSIRGEREFHLVRHRIDILEAEPGWKEDLLQLYELLDRFEARGK
jgi:hypothetical protein